ncbi:hypothetical protein TRAPUB_7255 [Trametes pubescens]|uniref:Asteroid domain-containing protein n=1 Tax=Trametes pubescens TaxID=154538 RepID=A0A1M2V3R6_TRAPU|nr:hypothetical protein TRAPUB_7255 [Trametes pubescens]
MGVHGLTTYLREHKSTLSNTLQLPLSHLPLTNGRNADGEGRIPVVVDGWSFIFEVVHCADLPWVYGGEYPQLSQLVRQVVHAWIEVGLHLHFVFDGPYPTLKFPTLISRHTQNRVQNALLFFRTSATARAAPRFLRETAMLPPLSYGVCVDTLLELAAGAHAGRLHVHIADEEGDPYAVALAGRLNAYVAGRDSDFVVLNTEGYLGYIPLDEMVWTAANAGDGDGSVYSLDTEPDVDDGGFKTARTGKARKKRAVADQQAGRGIIPPDDTQGLALSFTVYSPATLAAHLDIPASLLPLLGALVGNDFTGASDVAAAASTRRANLQRLFFERQLTLGQRIARAASTLSGLLAAAFGPLALGVQKKRTKKPIGSVMELIDAAVGALLLRPLDTFGPGEREAVVERVVEATLQYAIPRPPDEEAEGGEAWVSEACPLHVAEACPLVVSLSRRVALVSGDATPEDVPLGKSSKKAAEDSHAAVRAAYVAAYRRGRMNPHVLDAVQSATAWPWLFLEDPDKECVERSVGRPIREWMYAVLDASVGLPSPPVPEGEEGDGEEDEDDDEDELIDVVEEDDDVDPLARLRGALKELDSDDEDGESADDSPPPSVPSTLPSSELKIITEYVRRGTRLAPEEVAVTPLPELLSGIGLESPVHSRTRLPLPPPLWLEDMRRRLLLGALGSDGPAVAALPDARVLGVAALRFVVRRMHLRALEAPGVKERQQERWTRAEARAFLACVRPGGQHAQGKVEAEGEQVPILERHVQLVAQIEAALGAAERLAHVLLLAPAIPSPARHFSGGRFHAMVSGDGAQAGELEEGVWDACVEGLEDAFAALPQRKSKKEKRAKGAVQAAPPARGKAKGGSMFGLLADADA